MSHDIKNLVSTTLERMGAEFTELRPELHLESDLGLESLMRMELAAKLEKKLGLPIGDHIDGFDTVGQLLDFLDRSQVPVAS